MTAQRLTNKKKNIDDQSRITGSNILIPEEWRSLTPFLAAGFINFNLAGFNAPQYRKDPSGRVWLRGAIAQTTPAAIAQSVLLATMPIGYRPVNGVTVPVTTINGSSVVSIGAILINNVGAVLSYTNTLHGTYISFDNISFMAA